MFFGVEFITFLHRIAAVNGGKRLILAAPERLQRKFSVTGTEDLIGTYPLIFTIFDDNGAQVATASTELNIVPALQESFSMLVNETYGLSGDMEIPQGSSWKKEDELELSFYSGENELIDELTFAPYDFVFYAVKSVKGNSFLIHKNKYKKFLNILSFESAPEI